MKTYIVHLLKLFVIKKLNNNGENSGSIVKKDENELLGNFSFTKSHIQDTGFGNEIKFYTKKVFMKFTIVFFSMVKNWLINY